MSASEVDAHPDAGRTVTASASARAGTPCTPTSCLAGSPLARTTHWTRGRDSARPTWSSASEPSATADKLVVSPFARSRGSTRRPPDLSTRPVRPTSPTFPATGMGTGAVVRALRATCGSAVPAWLPAATTNCGPRPGGRIMRSHPGPVRRRQRGRGRVRCNLSAPDVPSHRGWAAPVAAGVAEEGQ